MQFGKCASWPRGSCMSNERASRKRRNTKIVIALLLDPTADREREIAQGVLNYAALHPQVTVFKHRAVPYLKWDELNVWRGDGLIAQADTRTKVNRLLRKKIPAVNVSSDVKPEALPTVHSDEKALGRELADHLLGLGLKNLAFAGNPDMFNDCLRYDGFGARVKKRNLSYSSIRLLFRATRGRGRDVPKEIDRSRLIRSLQSLTTPVGIAVAHDDFAHEVNECCRELGLRVPYDAAIVSINNYRLICETSVPPISSIGQRAEQIGYKATSLLHRLVRGERTPRKPLLVPPGELVVRRSSDHLVVKDDTVKEAVEVIRTSDLASITVDELANRLAVSRRTLFNRFESSLGHSPAQEIRMEQARRAKRLLMETQSSVTSVGLASGYQSTSSFIRAFRKTTGMTPSEYRLQLGDPLT